MAPLASVPWPGPGPSLVTGDEMRGCYILGTWDTRSGNRGLHGTQTPRGMIMVWSECLVILTHILLNTNTKIVQFLPVREYHNTDSNKTHNSSYIENNTRPGDFLHWTVDIDIVTITHNHN